MDPVPLELRIAIFAGFVLLVLLILRSMMKMFGWL